MSYKGFKFSEESRKKMSASAKRKPPMTLEHRKKISERLKGHIWNRGKKRTEEFKNKLSERMSGKNHPLWGSTMSEETKQKISKSETGKKDTLEARKKKSIARIGDKNPAWKGGISYEPYTNEWQNSLKELVRQRDNFICQECGIHQDELSENWHKKLDVHHIDYVKTNCSLENLISLCRQCHVKTNYNREYWVNYFTNKNHE